MSLASGAMLTRHGRSLLADWLRPEATRSRRQTTNQEPDMKNSCFGAAAIATVIVVMTYSIAAVSAAVAVLGGVI
jgi:hypothetical protein